LFVGCFNLSWTHDMREFQLWLADWPLMLRFW
jgi:hypothetical protein